MWAKQVLGAGRRAGLATGEEVRCETRLVAEQGEAHIGGISVNLTQPLSSLSSLGERGAIVPLLSFHS
ncbi:MAG: hypothetical protein DMG21_07000 [Acidobacteria bacterium]|nr:MAG: hypothetical protein DMG21_07000 [Acidobacteriota bacterium]